VVSVCVCMSTIDDVCVCVCVSKPPSQRKEWPLDLYIVFRSVKVGHTECRFRGKRHNTCFEKPHRCESERESERGRELDK